MDKAAIRNTAKAVLDRKRSEATIAQYRRVWRMLGGQHWLDYAEARNLSRRSAYRYKAAWQWGAAERCLDLLRQADRASRDGDKAAAKEARQEAERLAGHLQAEGDYDRQNRLREGHQAAYQGTHPRKGKRGTLKKLPDRWQMRIIEAAEERDRPAVLVMALSGVRPAEMAKGVHVEIVGDQAVRFSVEGAKTTQGYSQEWRQFTISGPEVERLVQAFREKGIEDANIGIDQSGKDPLANFRKRINLAAKKADMPDVSAYCMRHAAASELKASGASEEAIAAAMGHSATGTMQYYGHPQQSRGGGISLSDVEAAQEVRDTAQAPPGERPEPSKSPFDFEFNPDALDRPGPGPEDDEGPAPR